MSKKMENTDGEKNELVKTPTRNLYSCGLPAQAIKYEEKTKMNIENLQNLRGYKRLIAIQEVALNFIESRRGQSFTRRDLRVYLIPLEKADEFGNRKIKPHSLRFIQRTMKDLLKVLTESGLIEYFEKDISRKYYTERSLECFDYDSFELLMKRNGFKQVAIKDDEDDEDDDERTPEEKVLAWREIADDENINPNDFDEGISYTWNGGRSRVNMCGSRAKYGTSNEITSKKAVFKGYSIIE